jgi:hypothetical protein
MKREPKNAAPVSAKESISRQVAIMRIITTKTAIQELEVTAINPPKGNTRVRGIFLSRKRKNPSNKLSIRKTPIPMHLFV